MQLDLLFCSTLAVYLSSSVIIAAVRWGHKCEPYARHADYYYPGWKSIVFCFLCNLWLIPAIIDPGNEDAMLMLRMQIMLGSPLFGAMLLFSYFGGVLQVSWWRKPIFALGSSFLLMLAIALVLAIVPGTQFTGQAGRYFYAVGGVLAVLYLLSFYMAMRLISRALRRFGEENYSNPEDFPQDFARRSLSMSVLHVTVSWVASFVGTPLVLSLAFLFFSAFGVSFLITSLTPHRSMDIRELEEDPAALDDYDEGTSALSPARKNEILKAIRKYVEKDQGYLDSHLTLSSLSRSIGVNRSYVSEVMGDCLGGFFAYVNRCRLAHAARLKVEQPGISVGELIEASGFGSRQSYYNVKRQLEL